jgi:thiol:disulfide interchange protein DsbD
LKGILIDKDTGLATEIDVAVGAKAGEGAALAPPPAKGPSQGALTAPSQGASGGDQVTSIWLACILAFLGGLVLNIMPCVLPVLSLKILGFVEQANETDSKPVVHGMAFMFGVLVSFWVLAGILLALRAGGQALGWGFQMQTPGFVLFLAVFFFLFALSLFGVFEVGGGLMGVGAGRDDSGLSGSFGSGVLATLVATPCTAPLMGPALGFALAQPAWASMLVFTTLGLGMATPYVLLTAFPALLKFVPKPGAWMESFKQFLGFMLMATVVWLMWTFGGQTGNNALGIAMVGLVVAAMGAWILGRWGAPVKKKAVRTRARVAALVLVLGGFAVGMSVAKVPEQAVSGKVHAAGGMDWETFSPDTLQAHLSKGTPVFIDFTADWCLTCKFNEKRAFTPEVAEAFKAKGVVTMVADWTTRDDVIGKSRPRAW